MDLGTNNESIKNVDDEKKELLFKGIAGVMDSQEFKTYCDSMNKLMNNNYSPTNCNLIMNQFIFKYFSENGIDISKLSKEELVKKISEALRSNKTPSFLMGYEAWKQYGRQVTGKGVAYTIYAPQYVHEKYGKGTLLKSIKNSFKKQFDENQSLEFAEYKLGVTGLKFIGYKNGLIDIMLGEKVLSGKMTEEAFRKFLDNEVIGKFPNGFTTTYVYDVKDTMQPEYLWMKTGFTKDEIALDSQGNQITRKPYKNSNTVEYQIINSPSRIAKFNPHLDFSIKELDEEKMSILLEALKNISMKKGVPISEETIPRSGVSGFFSHSEKRIAVEVSLPMTEKVAVVLHEMAHADMHYLRKDLPKEIKEVQAESVAYMTARNFGIETDTSSFKYLAMYSTGRTLKELETSMNDILNQSKKLTKEISTELSSKGYDLSIELISDKEKEQPLALENKDIFIRDCKEYVLMKHDMVIEFSGTAKDLLQNTSDERQVNILKEQISICNTQFEKLEEMDKSLNELEKTSDIPSANILIDRTKKLFSQMDTLAQQFSDLSNEFVYRVQEMKDLKKLSLKELFTDNPIETMRSFISKSEDKSLHELTDSDLSYIAKSAFIRLNYKKLIKEDLSSFMEKSVEHLFDINQVKSKNGAFVEISTCEQWGDEPIFTKGTVMHPKTANIRFEEAEKLKGLYAEKGVYYPETRCKTTVFTLHNNEYVATSAVVDIGDAYQKNLLDHLEKAGAKDFVIDSYKQALKERVKDKIISPSSNLSSSNEKKSTVKDSRCISIDELKNTVSNPCSANESPRSKGKDQNSHDDHQK